MNILVVSGVGQLASEQISVRDRATVAEALAQSTIAGQTAHQVHGVALWGRVVALGTVLREGDRIELLAPLLADPKDARRVRANQSSEAAARKKQAARKVTKSA